MQLRDLMWWNLEDKNAERSKDAGGPGPDL